MFVTPQRKICVYLCFLALSTKIQPSEHPVLNVFSMNQLSLNLSMVSEPCKLTMWDSAGKEAPNAVWVVTSSRRKYRSAYSILLKKRLNKVSSMCTVLLDREGQVMLNYFMSSLMLMDTPRLMQQKCCRKSIFKHLVFMFV